MKYRDLSGNEYNKNTFQDRLLNKIYSSPLGRAVIKPLTYDTVSYIAGVFLSSKLSRILIKTFIKSNNIDMSLYERGNLFSDNNKNLNDKYYGYSSYNDFFTRKIKASERVIGNGEIKKLSIFCFIHIKKQTACRKIQGRLRNSNTTFG